MGVVTTCIANIIDNVEKVIVGKRQQIKLVVVAMLAGGHVLLEDVPGLGKTMLARSIARSIDADFKRIQFTPDITPNDIVGLNIWNQEKSGFEFRPGPIMANIVLADEINRGTPKTQSAMLEGMEEHQVTVDGVSYLLPQELFIVLATQNPIEYEGTYPLPEAQLDRFMMRIQLGYASREDALELMSRLDKGHPIDLLEPVAQVSDIITEKKRVLEDIFLHPQIRSYIYALVNATRNYAEVDLGVSDRALNILQRASKAMALVENRTYVLPCDVRCLAVSVLTHRLMLKPGARMKGLRAENIIMEIVNAIAEPPEYELEGS